MTAPKDTSTLVSSEVIETRNGPVTVELRESKEGVEILRLDLPLTGTSLSASGKSKMLAGTEGFKYVLDGIGISANIAENVKKPRVKKATS